MPKITVLHPISQEPIEGIRLGPGAELDPRTDRYDSTSGRWELATWCKDTTVPRRNPVIWVRPAGLSPEARQLLRKLATKGYLLTDFAGRWKMIPSPRWQRDGRMDWPAPDADELLSCGLIEKFNPSTAPEPTTMHDIFWQGEPDYDKIYQLSDAGRQLHEVLP